MLETTTSERVDVASFGPFRLHVRSRILEKDGATLALGSRALDILIVLVERAGEVVSHRELLASAWRGLVVDPGNLRVHIAALRKALGDTDRAPRYIANVTGQGYSFIAPLVRGAPVAGPTPTDVPTARRRLALPPALARMVGREDAVRAVAQELGVNRFVTVIGSGGMGKTTVAVAVTHAMLPQFGDAVCFVDAAAVSDANLLASTIASGLGLTIQQDDVLSALIECLRPLRVLLVLDNCEHVIDAAATLAEQVFKEASDVYILATSREALRVEGEHVYWLAPLECPAPNSTLDAATVREFPAVKLFMERVAASCTGFELADDDASAVAGICGCLDGLPLALELAAGRVGTHGIAGTAELIKKGLGLHWQGRRTAHPRHQTLEALLDWSYGLLTSSEQLALSRLSVLVGPFGIETAQAIAGDARLEVVDVLDRLVAKCLVSAAINGEGIRYRLLETARVYASKKLEQSGEGNMIARRHARYFAELLDGLCAGPLDFPRPSRGASLGEHLGNARAALNWCFMQPLTVAEDRRLAFDVGAAASSLLLELSLLTECYKWSRDALALLDDSTRGSRSELVLQEAHAISSSWTRGNGEDVRSAIARGIEIARELDAAPHLLRFLVGMQVFSIRTGDFKSLVPLADEFTAVARDSAIESFAVIAEWAQGVAAHFTGDQAAAQVHLEAGFAHDSPRDVQLFGLDFRVRALINFARVLWLRGAIDRAQTMAEEANREAARLNSALNVCFSFLYTAELFLSCGNHASASDALAKLAAHPNWRALPSFHATALALNGELLAQAGQVDKAIALLSSACNAMTRDRQKFLLVRATCALAQALIGAGRPDEAVAAIDNALSEARAAGRSFHLPELLRVKALVLLAMQAPGNEAERCLEESLACARSQSALVWELRAATALARLPAKRESRAKARNLLASIYSCFTEGLDTVDLKAARQALGERA